MIKSMKSPRRLAAVAVFAIVAMSAFGFAATNTVNPSNAGDGPGVVSGGTASAVHYTLDNNNEITGLSFTYSTVLPVNATVRVELLDASANVLGSDTCSTSGANVWDCSFGTPVSITPVTALRVVTAS